MNKIELTSIILNFILASGLLFFGSRKRKERAEAGSAEFVLIQGFAKEWREIAEKREKQLGVCNDKIDRLYGDITAWRDKCNTLEQELHDTRMQLKESEFIECRKRKCAEREPQTGF